MTNNSLAATMVRSTLDALIDAAGGDAHRLCVLARAAENANLPDRAYALARQARELAPHDPAIAAHTRYLISHPIPGFHAAMLNDVARNSAFERAIARAAPGARVLDIGAGSGLLSMMAARAGAASIVACEVVPGIADVARAIVAVNGFADRITIITGRSDALDADADLGGRADVIVAEIVADNLIGEGILPSLADAAVRLLTPGGTIIPRSGEIIVALAEWSRPEAGSIGCVAGFDVSAFDRLRRIPETLAADDDQLVLRSDGRALFGFAFGDPIAATADRATIALSATGGRVTGIVQWIRFQLDDREHYENAPGPEMRSHWKISYYPLPTPIEPTAGTMVRVCGSHDRIVPLIWIETTTT